MAIYVKSIFILNDIHIILKNVVELEYFLVFIFNIFYTYYRVVLVHFLSVKIFYIYY